MHRQIPPSFPLEETIVLGKPRMCRWDEDYVAYDIHSGLQPVRSQALCAADQQSSAQTKPALQMHSRCCWPNPAYPRKYATNSKRGVTPFQLTQYQNTLSHQHCKSLSHLQAAGSRAEQEQPVNRAMGLGGCTGRLWTLQHRYLRHRILVTNHGAGSCLCCSCWIPVESSTKPMGSPWGQWGLSARASPLFGGWNAHIQSNSP